MKFLADESVDGPLVRWLRQRGYDVSFVAELNPGASDESIIADAIKHERVLITSDRDFGELVFRRGYRPPGMLLIRIRSRSGAELLASFAAHWPAIVTKIPRSFVVVSRGRLRTRPM